MKLLKLNHDFSVCKVQDISQVDFGDEFIFLSKTDDEISLVCDTDRIPGNTTEVEKGWKALKIDGILDFSMVGVISNISRILAGAGISIFVVSTFNTDYILLKDHSFEKSLDLLRAAGYETA